MRLIIVSLISIFTITSCACNNRNKQDSSKTSGADTLSICSFNIQFLGSFKKKENDQLADFLKNFDIVVIQEMVAPPYSGGFPDGKKFKSDRESQKFVQAMEKRGFLYWLSEEDTGPGETNHKASTSTEWWICFYKDSIITPEKSLPHGFLALDRTANPKFERVPYAFSFKGTNSNFDFSLISVHLAPGDNSERRKQELTSIYNWIDSCSAYEDDFYILGDMNISGSTELNSVLQSSWKSLNSSCLKTNTAKGTNKPYDHVFYNSITSSEQVISSSFVVENILTYFEPLWKNPDIPYPGNPYDHNLFRQYYSDHYPISFKLLTVE